MFWWNLFLLGVLIWLLAAWASDELFDFDLLIIVFGAIYSIVYLCIGFVFLDTNDAKYFNEHPIGCSDCISLGDGQFCNAYIDNFNFIKAFTSNQTMINSLSPEMQAYLGVEERFSITAIVVNVIIIAAIVFVFCKWQDIELTYPFANDYEAFNELSCREVAIPYKFKVFKSVYDSLIISENNPFRSVTEVRLVYFDDKTKTSYRIHFPYIDYLRYRHFLFNRRADKKKYRDAESLETVLAFNEVLMAKLKEEGQRPFKDLVK